MKKPRYVILLLLLVGISLLVLTALLNRGFRDNRPTRTVAYVSLPSDINQQADSIQLLILQDLIKEYNKDSHIKLTLKKFFTKTSGDSINIKDTYKEIIKDTGIILAIDNLWQKHLLLAKDILAKNDLPVICINANFIPELKTCTVFLGDGSYYPSLISGMYGHMLGSKVTQTLTFITENDYKQQQQYENAFAKLHLPYQKYTLPVRAGRQVIDSSKVILDTLTSNIVQHLNNSNNNRYVFLNLHSYTSKLVISHLNQKSHDLTFIGGPEIYSNREIDTILFKNNNRMLFVKDPRDAQSDIIQNLIKKIKHTYSPLEKRKDSGFYVNRALQAFEILKKLIEKGQRDTKKTIYPDRKSLIANISDLENTNVITPVEILHFDTSHILLRDQTITLIDKFGARSFAIQINKYGKIIPNFSFGIELQDINNIDLNSNTFQADFYYWVKLDSTLQRDSNMVFIENIKLSESQFSKLNEARLENNIYRLYKVSGKFFAKFDKSQFPFDRHALDISIRILNPTDSVRISFDLETNDMKEIRSAINIPSWSLDTVYVSVNNKITNKSKGIISTQQKQYESYKNLVLHAVVQRQPWSEFVKIIFPLVLMGLFSILILFFRGLTPEFIGEIVVGIFLSVVAFSISIGDAAPKSSQPTRVDKIFILTFIVVLFNLLQVFTSIARRKSVNDKKLLLNRLDFLLNHYRWLILVLYSGLVFYFMIP